MAISFSICGCRSRVGRVVAHHPLRLRLWCLPASRSGFSEPTTVYSDGWITPLYYTKLQEVDSYIEAFGRLTERSLDEEASPELIRSYLERSS